ncbi:hypothetical protein PC112_g18986 [Phytophthora cactorum]|nr:hypothetical protein PC112_g18986 [Phytophthora cactorum]
MIHTAAGPIEPTEAVPHRIVDTDEDEFIVGHKLEQLAAHRDDETSCDQFELEADEPPVDSSHIASDEEVCAAMGTLIHRAMENAFPPNKEDKLRLIVYAYDIWRLVLPDDRVPTLEVRLKEGRSLSNVNLANILRTFDSSYMNLSINLWN